VLELAAAGYRNRSSARSKPQKDTSSRLESDHGDSVQATIIETRGEDLIAAGLLMLAGPVDLDELDRWMRIGWERRRGADIPYGQGFSGT
jgi:hypothetical protein